MHIHISVFSETTPEELFHQKPSHPKIRGRKFFVTLWKYPESGPRLCLQLKKITCNLFPISRIQTLSFHFFRTSEIWFSILNQTNLKNSHLHIFLLCPEKYLPSHFLTFFEISNVSFPLFSRFRNFFSDIFLSKLDR